MQGRVNNLDVKKKKKVQRHRVCTCLFSFVLGQVGFELEVGFELAGAELALVGAVDHNDLFGLSLALLVLVRIVHLDLRVPVLRVVPSPDLVIHLGFGRTLLHLNLSFCNQVFY